MKFKLFIIFLVLSSTMSNAQKHSFSLLNGISFANITNNPYTLEKSLKTGFISGLTYEYQLKNNWLFNVGLEYQQKGVKYDTSFWIGMDTTYWTVYRKNNYINTPISLGYSFGNKLSGNIYLGVAPSFLTSSDVIQVYKDGYEYQHKDEGIEKFDINGLIQFGISYKINNKFKINNVIRSQYGFIDLYNSSEKNVRNFTYSYLIGIQFYPKIRNTEK